MAERTDADDAAPPPDEAPVPVVPPPPVAAVHRPAGWQDRGAAARPSSAAAPEPDQGGGRPAMRVDRGAVTERVVNEAAAARCRLVLGPSAVLTPSGRDRARQLGVEIEQEKRR